MLRVPLPHARPGMMLAAPVYHPRRADTLLLEAGFVLDDRAIARLRELSLRDLWVHYPGVPLLTQFVSPAVFEAQAALTNQIAVMISAVQRSASVKLEYSSYRHAVAGLLDKVLENPRSTLFIQEMADRDQPALRHASNVCVLSVLMGLKLEDYLVHQRSRLSATRARDVSNLGVGAMLHDIGMLRLDAAVLGRWNSAQDESDEAWREHVLIGYKLLSGDIESSAAAAVLHHHQHFDGSGFPKRKALSGAIEPVAGQDIHVFARIVAAADLFDRLRHPAHAPGGEKLSMPSIPIVRALRLMQQPPYRDWIDPMVFKALINVLPPYAPGTIVRLTDGREAIVIDWTPSDPCRPMLAVVKDLRAGFDRRDVECEKVNLRQRPDLAIAEADGHIVAGDNFYPRHAAEWDLTLAGKSLINRATDISGRELLSAS